MIPSCIFLRNATCKGKWSWMRMALPPSMARKASRFPNDLRYALCTRPSRGCPAHGCNVPSRESPRSRWRGMTCPPPLPIPSMASIRRRKGWSWDFGCNFCACELDLSVIVYNSVVGKCNRYAGFWTYSKLYRLCSWVFFWHVQSERL